MITGQSFCGQSMITNQQGESRAQTYYEQVTKSPVPVSVANANTAYYKVPVNLELSSQYRVGVERTLLPTGWSTTTPEQLVTVSTSSEHLIVELGVKYTANGTCGSATTTGMTSPTTNLCAIGTSTSPVDNGQNFTWTCSGVGGGTEASCTKPKCGVSNPYYCAVNNSCVLDEAACTIGGVCGSATAQPGRNTEGTPVVPSVNLCSAGSLNGVVAGAGDGVSSFTWTCLGQNGGASSPTCSQPKCSSPMRYCATENECRASCPVTSTSTLIFDTQLAPRIVRKATDQCLLSWTAAASEELPVSCTLNGAALPGGATSIDQRSTSISVGNNTLVCTNGEVSQSTSTRCILNPSFREI